LSCTNSTDLFYCCSCSGNVRLAVVDNLSIDEDSFSGHKASLVESQSYRDCAWCPAAAWNHSIIAQL